MNIRKEIRTLSASELLDLRMAMQTFQDKTGPGSYHEIAGYHGLPRKKCAHDPKSSFLAWHRFYVYWFEAELQKINSTVSIPYWDWTDESTFSHCIAPAYEEATFIDSGGSSEKNPLVSALIADSSRQTLRSPHFLPRVLETAKKMVGIALSDDTKTLEKLGDALFTPHGTIHTCVGLDFASTPQAAYDPLFWAHHATVDRQWAIWQKNNPDYKVDPATLNFDLNGFIGKKIQDVIDHQKQLGYTYDNLNLTQSFNKRVIVLVIQGVETTEEPLFIEAYLETPTIPKTALGIFGIFAMGQMDMADMHMEHEGHHTALFNVYLDITEVAENKKLNTATIDPQTAIAFIVKDQSGTVLKSKKFEYHKLLIEGLK